MFSMEKHIFELEAELLKPETRKSSERIRQLLSEDFIEFCSSGYVYYYKKGDVFYSGDNSEEMDWNITDFSIRKLSEYTVLATYKLIKNNEQRENMKYSLRSSIWECFNDQWKMVFHQGTLAADI